MKKITVILLMTVMCLALTVNAGAVSYTYDSEGKAVESPDAYSVAFEVSGLDMGVGALSAPTDIKISDNGVVAISDSANGRVIITDLSFKSATVLKTFDKNETEDSFKTPMGLCFDSNGHLYVCDKENGRIVEFDTSYKYVRAVENPQKELLPEGFIFAPSAVAVDKWGTVYCISDSSTNGYLQFDKSGVFKGFMGSPEVTLTLAQKFWRAVQTDAQRDRTSNEIPVNYNNLVVDSDGFLYTTEAHPNKEDTAIAIQGGQKSGLFMPIKKFNFNGTDVLKRQDFFAPAGDVSFEKSIPENEKNTEALWASSLVSIALGDDGCYFAADSKRGKLFGYDANGNLLYAFGGSGAQVGRFSSLTAVEYHEKQLYALDKNQGTVTCFTLTDYGSLIHNASRLTTERRFEEAAELWQELLKLNSNLTIAYIGLGRSYLEAGEYDLAMDYFKTALSMDNYSEAFSRYREKVMGDWFLAIPEAIIAVIAGVALAFAKCKKFNSGTSPKRTRLSGHMLYSAHVIFRPFDGFWDIKHEKRGSAKAAAIFLGVAAICVALQYRFMGFAFTGGKTTNPLLVAVVILGAALVFCLSNWCLTSLTNGKGSMKDIFTVTGYSCVPLILMSVPVTVMSNILTADEAGFVTLFVYIAYIWTALLLFTGIMTAHEYSLGQNIASIVFTLVGMVVILFLAFLLINLGGRIASFVSGLSTEIGLRN